MVSKSLSRTWWGDEWLKSMEFVFWDHVVSAGKKLVINDGVKDLKIEGNTVSAKIKGVHKSYYEAIIGFEDFKQEDIDVIMQTINENPFILSALLNHELPKDLYYKLLDKDINVFPFSFSNLTTYCSCDEWVDFCKHKVALICYLALEIDKDPFLLFKLQGCDLLKKLNFTEDINEIKNCNELLSIDDNLDVEVGPVDFSKIPDLSNEIFFLLKDNPIFFHENFKTILNRIYKALPRFMKKDVDKYTRKTKDKKYNARVNLNGRMTKFKGSSVDYIPWLDDYFLKRWKMPNNWSEFKFDLNQDYTISQITINSLSRLDKEFPNETLFDFFTELSESRITKFNLDIQFLNLIYRFSLEIIKKQAFIPQLFKSEENYCVRWIPAIFDKDISSIIDKIAFKSQPDLITFCGEQLSRRSQVIVLSSLFIKGFINIFLKNNSTKSLQSNLDEDIFKLFFFEGLSKSNQSDITSVNQWLSKFNINIVNHDLYFVVEEIEDSFSLNIKVNDDLKEITDVIYTTENDDLKKQLLKDLSLINEIYPKFKDSFEKNYQLILDIEEFSEFFQNTLPLFEIMGLNVILPKSVNNVFKPTISLNIYSTQNVNSYISLDDITDFDWKVQIGNYECSLEEFEEISREMSGFVKFAEDYVLLDKDEVEDLINRMKNLPDQLNNQELIKAMLAGEYMQAQVNMDNNLENLVSNYFNYDNITVPGSVNAQLRPYQEVGFSWLVQNMETGFGSILADDMGLGKTLEVLTTIQYFADGGYLENEKVLIVGPTGLLSNWQKEIEKFTPNLKSYMYYGDHRYFPNEDYDIYLTSYGVIRNEVENFKNKKWFLLIVDEAQNLKNPQAKQTKAIKSIKSKHKIAVSGTPIENRLSDYWSIFDFINKGYLTNLKTFKKHYIVPIERERNMEVLEDFKKITRPFILRRLKSDSNIIADLPDKIINDVYCDLTPKQVALYKKTVDMAIDSIENEEGIQRKGLVLKLINSLKQICNHPAQFTKKDKYSINESGKLKTLISTLENIFESNEKVLIFTQYQQMGEIIKDAIYKAFSKEAFFLHGSISRSNRDKIIEEFQSSNQSQALIITLKTGGTGLNLTAANNVIHYDLWWNPAVENQATDRAYRIGQTENVMVYRFITYGTFEEKINEVISDKKELANQAVGSGETFITELNDEDLKELMMLRFFS